MIPARGPQTMFYVQSLTCKDKQGHARLLLKAGPGLGSYWQLGYVPRLRYPGLGTLATSNPEIQILDLKYTSLQHK